MLNTQNTIENAKNVISYWIGKSFVTVDCYIS